MMFLSYGKLLEQPDLPLAILKNKIVRCLTFTLLAPSKLYDHNQMGESFR
jgi:hypothetical protein